MADLTNAATEPTPSAPAEPQQPQPRRRREPRPAPPTRVAYTQHATPGDDDDLIRSSALVRFWKIMAWAGGIAILGWVLYAGYAWGSSGCYTCVKNAFPAQNLTPSGSREEIRELRSLVEKLVSPAKTAPVIEPTPPRPKRSPVRHDDHCDCPPAVPQTPPAPTVTQPPADPMAGMTASQRCDYQIVVQRRVRCQ